MTIYTGDILIQLDDNDDYDIIFTNGQPEMTNGLETLSILSVFGQDWWGNDIVRTESEKMKSTFPDVIRRNVVNDDTKNSGTRALEKALAFFISDNIAKKITITGEILNAFTIVWLIEIEALTDNNLKFFINWASGELTAGLVT